MQQTFKARSMRISFRLHHKKHCCRVCAGVKEDLKETVGKSDTGDHNNDAKQGALVDTQSQQSAMMCK